MEYILISNEHTISERLSYFLYGVGGVDEDGRLIVSYRDVSPDIELVKDIVYLLNRQGERMRAYENLK